MKDKVGVILPGFTPDKPATCIGGWQVAVSAFSKNKAEAAKLAVPVEPRRVEDAGRHRYHMPVFLEVYTDPDVLKVNPWFGDALKVVQTARARPVTARYNEVSEVIRTNMNAFLAGTKTQDAALSDMQNRLGNILR